MKSRSIVQLVVVLAATALLQSQLAQAQVRRVGSAPAAGPVAGAPAASLPSAGTPVVSVPPTGNPPGGLPLPATPPNIVPPAGTQAPGGMGTPPDLGMAPTLTTPNNNVMRPMTNQPFGRPSGTNGFDRWGGRGDGDDMRRIQPYGSNRWDNRIGTNGAPGAGARGFEGGTNSLTSPQGVLSAPR
jgi:hypothetical protein